MKAVVFHAIGDIRLDDVPDPGLENDAEAIIRITHSAVCGTDLHMIRGTLPGMQAGTILGHEAVGEVVETGKQARNLNVGDRVVVPSTMGCGYCSYCRSGYHAQCDTINPGGTAFFGGPGGTGPFDGLQAEYARIPFAAINLVKLQTEITDDDALMASDILPTAYFGAEMAQVAPGKSVTVLGVGPVGLFTIVCAQLLGAGRVLAVDNRASRLAMARAQGAEIINFDEEDPLEAVRELTGGIGTDCVIDAVGVDAEHARHGPAAPANQDGGDAQAEQDRAANAQAAPHTNPDGELWKPGGAPTQALEWAVQMVAKAGTVSIIGVYPPTQKHFPIGTAMQRNLTLRMGNCHHRRYIPRLLDWLRNGTLRPGEILTQREPLTDVIEAYEQFDKRAAGWMKVALNPSQ